MHCFWAFNGRHVPFTSCVGSTLHPQLYPELRGGILSFPPPCSVHAVLIVSAIASIAAIQSIAAAACHGLPWLRTHHTALSTIPATELGIGLEESSACGAVLVLQPSRSEMHGLSAPAIKDTGYCMYGRTVQLFMAACSLRGSSMLLCWPVVACEVVTGLHPLNILLIHFVLLGCQ